jgi:hypothetical protein
MRPLGSQSQLAQPSQHTSPHSKHEMFDPDLRTSRGTNPLSFYASDIHTAIEIHETISQLERIDEEPFSARSSILTALPPLPVRHPGRSHRRSAMTFKPQRTSYAPLPLVYRQEFTRMDTPSPILTKETGSQSEMFTSPTPPSILKGTPRRPRRLVWLVIVAISIVVLAVVLGVVLTIYLGPKGKWWGPGVADGGPGSTTTFSPAPTSTQTSRPTPAPLTMVSWNSTHSS